MNILKVVDVVDVGIDKERIRQHFYAQAAEQFKQHPEVHTLFQQLSAWEGTHVKQFQTVRDRLVAHRPQEQYPGEMTAYIAVLLEHHLRIDDHSETLPEKFHTPIDAIDMAIAFEKEAILLFMELLPYVQEGDKSAIQTLMAEERQHVVHLVGLRQRVS